MGKQWSTCRTPARVGAAKGRRARVAISMETHHAADDHAPPHGIDKRGEDVEDQARRLKQIGAQPEHGVEVRDAQQGARFGRRAVSYSWSPSRTSSIPPHRKPHPDMVRQFVASIGEVDLLNPIILTLEGEFVTGRNRSAAFVKARTRVRGDRREHIPAPVLGTRARPTARSQEGAVRGPSS